jgi:hypothetical protein
VEREHARQEARPRGPGPHPGFRRQAPLTALSPDLLPKTRQ